MKIFNVVCNLAMVFVVAGGIEAKSIKEAREAGKLKVKSDMVSYIGVLRPGWVLDSWEGIVELARDYPDLQELWLSGNKLPSPPPEIGQLKNLQVLVLNSNKLTSLPREIGQLKNLQKLVLAGNKLTSLPREIEQLKNLRELNLVKNKLNNSQALGVLAKMKRLKLLILGRNGLSFKQKRWIKKKLPNTQVSTNVIGLYRR